PWLRTRPRGPPSRSICASLSERPRGARLRPERTPRAALLFLATVTFGYVEVSEPRSGVKFFCEQCKAKYQIADEKVAGKTVRMKCRKCGHLIEVKAEVTETSVASKAPGPNVPDPAEHDNEHDAATRVGMDVQSMLKMSTGPNA